MCIRDRAIVDPDFDGFQREYFPTTYVCNTEYDGLIHMSHRIGLHAEVEKELPPHVHLAYDGLHVSC